MASQWFYKVDGKKTGPVSSQQLKQLADEGQIQATTLLWREGIGDWVEAQRVKGLFTDAGDSSVALSGILKRGTAPSHDTSSQSSDTNDHSAANRSGKGTSNEDVGRAPTPAPSQWFYEKDGEKIGPVSSPQLKQLADSGQLQSTDLVWRKGIEEWVEAIRVKGLFSDAGDSRIGLSGIGKRPSPEASYPASSTSHEEPASSSPDRTEGPVQNLERESDGADAATSPQSQKTVLEREVETVKAKVALWRWIAAAGAVSWVVVTVVLIFLVLRRSDSEPTKHRSRN